MAGNHKNFRSNQFASYIIPLVDHFSTPGARYNPFEAWAAANVLTAFTQRWQGPSNNLNGTYAERTGDGNTRLVDTFASKIEYAAGREKTVAFTNVVKQLEKKLKSAFTGNSNAWVDWLYAVDYFFKNVPFVDYILDIKFKGEYTDLLYDSLAMTKHPNLTVNGYDFIITNPGQAPTPATTTITLHKIGLNEGQPNAYFIMWANDTDRYIVWWPSGGLEIPPSVLPTFGVNDYYIQVNGTLGNTAAQVQQSTIDAVNAIGLGTLFTAVPGQTINPGPDELREVIITLNAVEVVPPVSTFQLSTINTFFWSGTFTQAAPPVEGEQFIIDFRNTIASDLNSKFSVIVDPDTADNHVIWWNVDGTGAQPVVDVAAPIYTEINILSTDPPTQISKKLELEITGGALNFMNLVESGEILKLEFVAEIAMTGEELKPGSAASGVDFEFFDKLYASDNTELASGIDNINDYIAAFNDLKVPYEFNTYGYRYPYIIGNTVGGAVFVVDGGGGGSGSCGTCPGGAGAMQGYVKSNKVEGCDKCFATANVGQSSLRTAPYPGGPYGTPVNYNTPGTIFNVVEGGKNVLSVKDGI